MNELNVTEGKMNIGMLKEPILSPTGPCTQNSAHLFKEFSRAILSILDFLLS